MADFREEVAVIGGGTAGMIAAKGLAAQGIGTVVYEQKQVLGVPIRASGILSLKGLEGLGIGYEKAVTNTLCGADLHAAGKTMRIRTREPVAVVLNRKFLNDICRDEAAAEGAKIEMRRRITGAELESLANDKIIVGADGAISSVARHFSMGSVERHFTTYKAEFNTGIPDPTVVELFFDRKLAPGLFAWLCPNAKDILEVGIGMDANRGNVKAAFDRFMKTDAVAEAVGGGKLMEKGASIIPVGLRKRIVDTRRKVLLVGDAAGQVKHSTGGGIIFGGNAAIMAADAITSHVNHGEDLRAYERAFMKNYRMEIMLHYFANRFYSSLSAQNLGRTISLMNGLGIDRFLGEYGDMDRPSLTVKRFFLRGLVG